MYSHYYSLAMLDVRVMWQAVCRYEGVNVSTEVLGTLAELTDNDIRSCLNTLQFLKYAVLRTCGCHHGPFLTLTTHLIQPTPLHTTPGLSLVTGACPRSL